MQAIVEATRQITTQRLGRNDLRTPKVAAVAGFLFSALMVAIYLLLRTAMPADPREPGAWLRGDARHVEIALNLFPFAAIAFLWFIAFLRDRLGRHEDRFFSTMFFGSGQLFLGMLFTLAALTGGILIAFSVQPQATTDSAAFHIARAACYNIVNSYIAKMAAIFVFTTSAVTSKTGIVPRWLTLGGYALSLTLLVGSYYVDWAFIAFPLWVLLLSCSLLRSGPTP
jgi:hypothetical protein